MFVGPGDGVAENVEAGGVVLSPLFPPFPTVRPTPRPTARPITTTAMTAARMSFVFFVRRDHHEPCPAAGRCGRADLSISNCSTEV